MKKSRWQFLIDFVCNDTWRKVVALFLALLLYLAISPRTSEKREKSFSNVPVEIELPANVALSSGERPKVKVTIHGNIKALDEVDPGLLRIRAEVHADADRLIPGEAYLLRLRFDDVSGLPYGARVTSISPRDLPLNLERVVSKQLEVKARYDSQEKLLPDFDVTGVHFVPSKVLLSGPEQVLNSIKFIYTEPIPLSEQVTESFEYRAPLRIPQGTRSDHTKVDAYVDVTKAITTHTFRVGPLSINQSADSTRKFKVSDPFPNQVSVKLSGPRGTLAKLHNREISASVSLGHIDKPGTYELKVSVNIPNSAQGVTIRGVEPDRATVTVVQE
jgi:YbbR domain-containing protein